MFRRDAVAATRVEGFTKPSDFKSGTTTHLSLWRALHATEGHLKRRIDYVEKASNYIHMTDWEKSQRMFDRAQRAAQREAAKRLRDLDRQMKEKEKMDALEAALLEVQQFEAKVDVLLSLHRESVDPVEWLAEASKLAPLPPSLSPKFEMAARSQAIVRTGREKAAADAAIKKAVEADRSAETEALKTYQESLDRWKTNTPLAHQVLAKDPQSYGKALEAFSSLTELTEMGIGMDFTMHTPTLVECVIAMKGAQIIPNEAKTMTASNKLSVKPMPRQRFHEVYQDYVCGGVLRVARECFAVLPIDRVLVTAVAPIDQADKPVLSVVIARRDLAQVDFGAADASDTVGRLRHRGDFKASRKSGAFLEIQPFTPADALTAQSEAWDFDSLRSRVSSLRQEIQSVQETVHEIIP